MARQRPGAPLRRATSRPRARAAGTARPARAARTPRARLPHQPPPARRSAAGLLSVHWRPALHAPHHMPCCMLCSSAHGPADVLQRGAQGDTEAALHRAMLRPAVHSVSPRPGQGKVSRTRCTGSRPAASARAQTVCTFAAPTAAAAAVMKSQRLRSESRSST